MGKVSSWVALPLHVYVTDPVEVLNSQNVHLRPHLKLLSWGSAKAGDGQCVAELVSKPGL